MLPKPHILYGAILSLIALLIFPSIGLYALLIFLASFLIDFDHYFIYAIRKKNFSLKKAVKYFKDKDKKLMSETKKGKNIKCPIALFHTFEFLILVAVFSFFSKFIFFIFLGILFHSLIDAIDINARFNSLSPRIWSLTWYAKNRKRKDVIYL